jgi:hypothetical protein
MVRMVKGRKRTPDLGDLLLDSSATCLSCLSVKALSRSGDGSEYLLRWDGNWRESFRT